jgi:hypothetical protein
MSPQQLYMHLSRPGVVEHAYRTVENSCNMLLDGAYNIGRVYPPVIFCVSVVWTDPGTVRMVRFHEARCTVEDGGRERFRKRKSCLLPNWPDTVIHLSTAFCN